MILSQSYVNPLVIFVIQHMLYGFQSPLLDAFLAEGVGLIAGAEYSPETISPDNTRIDLLSVSDGPWITPKSEVI